MSARDRSSTGSTLDWLLESGQPAVRYGALTDLLGRSADDPEVRDARASVGRRGWAAELFARQSSGGFWEPHEPKTVREYVRFLRFPVFGSSVWQGMVLADLGVTSADRRVRKFSDLVFRYLLPLSSPVNIYTEEVCIVGNVAAMMTKFGYGDDPRIRRLFDWLLADQRDDGGWNCSSGTPGTLDAWEALAAFATVAKAHRSAAMERSIVRGAEFYLERKLFEEGKRYAPWFRFHFPAHYFYDVLVGLDVLTQLGYGGDRRLRPALEVLGKQRRADGRWTLERNHPDVEPAGDRPTARPLVLESAGSPSLWLTLTALRVLHRVENAR